MGLKTGGWKNWVLLFVVAVAASGSFYFLQIYSRHSFAKLDTWFSTKAYLRNAMSDTPFSHWRQPLSGSRLNLGGYYGFEEITYGREITLSEMSFEFELRKGAYLLVLVERGERGSRFFRLSSNPSFPSGFFRIDDEARITEKAPVPDLVAPGQRHRARIEFRSRDWIVSVDGRPIGAQAGAPAWPSPVSFRGSLIPAFIDDVHFLGPGIDWTEDFSPRHSGVLFLRFFAIFLGALLLCLWVSGSVFGTAAGFVSMAFIFWSVLAFDRLYWVGLNPGMSLPRNLSGRVALAVEKVRSKFFLSVDSTLDPRPGLVWRPKPDFAFLGIYDWRREWGREGHEQPYFVDTHRMRHALGDAGDLAGLSEARAFKILFAGTSQLWGAGASNPGRTIANRVLDAMTATLARPSEAAMATICGASSERILQEVRKILGVYWPDVMVVDLGNNDIFGVPSLGIHLRAMLELARTARVPVVLLAETNSPEIPDRLEESRAEIAAVAREFGIPWVDTKAFFWSADVRDSGLAWWDIVHLTDYGQRLMADLILKSLKDLRPVKGAGPAAK